MIILITKRELKSYLRSPLTYVILGLFSLIVGWFFFNLLVNYIEGTQNIPNKMNDPYSFLNQVVMQLFGNMNFLFLFLAPILTMRVISEDMKSSLIDLYFLSPLKTSHLVLGKFLSLCIVGFVIISTTMLFPYILSISHFNQFSFVLWGYIGLFLNVFSYFSMGVFASSLSKNQIISAMMSFLIILTFWMFGWVSQLSSNYYLTQFFDFLSINKHYEHFTRSFVSISDFMYYFSVIFFFLFLSAKSLEARKW